MHCWSSSYCEYILLFKVKFILEIYKHYKCLYFLKRNDADLSFLVIMKFDLVISVSMDIGLSMNA